MNLMARKWVAVDFGGPEVLRKVQVDVPVPDAARSPSPCAPPG